MGHYSRALNLIECIGIFLDPRRKKSMSEDYCIGGGYVLQTMAISDIEELGHRIARERRAVFYQDTDPYISLISGSCTSLRVDPAATLPRISLVMEQRCLARLTAAGQGRIIV